MQEKQQQYYLEKMKTSAFEDFKLGLKHKPNETNIAGAAAVEERMPHEKNIVAAAAVEKMMAGATEDFKPGLKPKQRENSIQQQRESRRRSFVGRVQFRDSLDNIVRMG